MLWSKFLKCFCSDLNGSEWVSYEQFQKIILQEISELKVINFITRVIAFQLSRLNFNFI